MGDFSYSRKPVEHPHVGSVRPGARGTRWGGVGLTRVWVWRWGGAGRRLACEPGEGSTCQFKRMRSNGHNSMSISLLGASRDTGEWCKLPARVR